MRVLAREAIRNASASLSMACRTVRSMPALPPRWSVWVESRKGAVPEGPFPFPAHQTGRADFRHPAFRRTSYPAHAGSSSSRPLEAVYSALSVHDCVGKLPGTTGGRSFVTPPHTIPHPFVHHLVYH